MSVTTNITNKAKDTNELIVQLAEPLLNNNPSFILALFLIAYLAPKLPSLLKFLTYFRDRSFKNYEQAKMLLELDILEDDYKYHIQENIEYNAFKDYSGIKACKKKRRILIKFFNDHPNDIEWGGIRWALKHMKFNYDENTFKIEFKWWKPLEIWFCKIYGIFTVCTGVLFVIVGLITEQHDIVQLLKNLSFGAMLILLGFYFIIQNSSYKHAEIIKCLLTKNLNKE